MAQSPNDLKQLFLLLKNIDRRITNSFDKRTGVSLTRYELLFHLYNNGNMTQTALQQALYIDQAAITRHLKILEEKEYVTRQRNAQNNREVIVKISDEGKNLLNNCDINKNQLISELYNGFSTEEIQLLEQLIKRLNRNVENL